MPYLLCFPFETSSSFTVPSIPVLSYLHSLLQWNMTISAMALAVYHYYTLIAVEAECYSDFWLNLNCDWIHEAVKEKSHMQLRDLTLLMEEIDHWRSSKPVMNNTPSFWEILNFLTPNIIIGSTNWCISIWHYNKLHQFVQYNGRRRFSLVWTISIIYLSKIRYEKHNIDMSGVNLHCWSVLQQSSQFIDSLGDSFINLVH